MAIASITTTFASFTSSKLQMPVGLDVIANALSIPFILMDLWRRIAQVYWVNAVVIAVLQSDIAEKAKADPNLIGHC